MAEVAELVESNPMTSSRRASAETGVLRRSLQRILHDLGVTSSVLGVHFPQLVSKRRSKLLTLSLCGSGFNFKFDFEKVIET